MYQLTNILTNTTSGHYKTAKAAHRAADRKDNAYGAYIYIVTKKEQGTKTMMIMHFNVDDLTASVACAVNANLCDYLVKHAHYNPNLISYWFAPGTVEYLLQD